MLLFFGGSRCSDIFKEGEDEKEYETDDDEDIFYFLHRR